MILARRSIDAMSDAASTPTQPCLSCGRPTAAGSLLFAGRRVIPPAADDSAAESSYLCEECEEQIHASAREGRMNDAQLREAIERGEVAGWNYRGAGRFGPITQIGGDGGIGGI